MISNLTLAEEERHEFTRSPSGVRAPNASQYGLESQSDGQKKTECFCCLDTSVGIYRLAGVIVDIQVFDDGYLPEQDNLHALCPAFLSK